MDLTSIVGGFLTNFLTPDNVNDMISQGGFGKLLEDVIKNISTMDDNKLAMLLVMLIEMRSQDSSVKQKAIESILILSECDKNE